MDADRCVICGDIIPEGMMVCPLCDKKIEDMGKNHSIRAKAAKSKAVGKCIGCGKEVSDYVIFCPSCETKARETSALNRNIVICGNYGHRAREKTVSTTIPEKRRSRRLFRRVG